jgi:UDP-glucose 4-epimerase
MTIDSQMTDDTELHVVTGGAGFIGSHLVQKLLDEGHRVRVIDDLSTGRRDNVPSSVEFLEGDVNDLAREGVEGARVIYHLAAQVSVPESVMDPLGSHHATASGTVAVLEAAERAGVSRVVLASSSAVYGNDPRLPKQETHEPVPASPYAVAKLCSEHYARYWATNRAVEAVCLRFFNVYGPRQDPRSAYAAAIPIFLEHLLAGRPVPVYGDGQQTRDFTYVGDVVAAILSAAQSPHASGGVYNVAMGKGTSVLELLGTMAELLGVSARIEHLPERPGDVRHSMADITAATKDLGLAPRTSLREGLSRTIAWFRWDKRAHPEPATALSMSSRVS